MRPGTDAALTSALEASGIRTAILAWFEFASGGLGIWTGSHTITVIDADPLLNGKTFEPISEGVMIEVGLNSFSYTGSEALVLSLAVPDVPTDAMVAASASPEEYQGRTAILWRAIMVTPPNAISEAVWAFRRTRAGAMDELSISNTGTEHFFSLTIEGHASMISNASGSNYLSQPDFDSTDTSQAYAVSIANNPNTPGTSSMGRSSGGSSGGSVGDPFRREPNFNGFEGFSNS